MQVYVKSCTGRPTGTVKLTEGRMGARGRSVADRCLRGSLIKFPHDKEGKQQIKEGFYRLARFPSAVNGTQVPIQSRGSYFLILLMRIFIISRNL